MSNLCSALISGVRAFDARGLVFDGQRTDIAIADGKITAVSQHSTTPKPKAATVIDAHNLIAAPGFVNGHQHSHELPFRGCSERMPLEVWMTSVRPDPPLPLSAEDVFLRTAVVAAEALKTGTTTICDDVAIDPVSYPEHLDAVARAYEAAGIRAFVGPTLFDRHFAQSVPFVAEVLPLEARSRIEDASRKLPKPSELLAALGRFAIEWERRGGLVSAIAAPSAPQRCSRALLSSTSDLAGSNSLPILTHVLETRVQAVMAQEEYGKSFVQLLDECGLLRPGTSLIHANWISSWDIEKLAKSGASVQHNPMSNLKLGSGVAPLRKLLDAGINVSVASDGCGSIETIDLAPSIGLAGLLSTLRGEPDCWLTAGDAFEAATLGGARSLNLGSELGRLEVGQMADIVLYRSDRPPFLPINDLLRQFVYGGTCATIDSVFVNGRLVVQKGVLLTLNEDDLAERLSEMHARIGPDIARARAAAGKLAPYMRAIWDRCECTELRKRFSPVGTGPRLQ